MDVTSVLHDRYQIQAILGHGGFAVTYRALDLQTEQQCAIKSLSFKNIDTWKTWELFQRESEILKNLNHPQIPKYIDSFIIEKEREVECYLVQQYVEGKSLAQLIQEGKCFTEQEVIKIACHLTIILEYLHSFSPPLIHRDITPNNIILTHDHQVFLIDFGSVRDKMLLDYTMGGSSTIIGTYGYMPLEQFQGRALPASDIYALGMTLIYLLSRRSPLALESYKKNIDIRAYTKISRGFTLILEKMVHADYKKRYKTVQKVSQDLTRLSAGKVLFRMRRIVLITICGSILIFLTRIGVIWFDHYLPEITITQTLKATQIEVALTKDKEYAPLKRLSLDSPLVWHEGDVELSLKEVALGSRSGHAPGGLRKSEGWGNYQENEVIYSVTLFLTIDNRTFKQISVPLNVRRIIDETGRMALPNTQQFMFTSTGGLAITPGSAFEQEVVFVVPEKQTEFLFTTGGQSNIHFKLYFEKKTAKIIRIE